MGLHIVLVPGFGSSEGLIDDLDLLGVEDSVGSGFDVVEVFVEDGLKG
jgi:hypothetical protein